MIQIRWRSHPEDGQLVAFADDELAGAERIWVTSHLSRCQRCRTELESLETARRKLESCLGEIPKSWLDSGKQSLLRAFPSCSLDPRTRSILFGAGDSLVSCRMIEEIVGQAAVPG